MRELISGGNFAFFKVIHYGRKSKSLGYFLVVSTPGDSNRKGRRSIKVQFSGPIR